MPINIHKRIEKWVPMIESEIGEPIRTTEEASKMAVLLESKVTLNKGYFEELERHSALRDKIDPFTKGLYTKYLNGSHRVYPELHKIKP